MSFDRGFSPTTTESGQVPCSYHPRVLTGLRCSRCGKPICPDCAGVRGLPTYRTSGSVLLRATGAGLLVAIGVAVLWRFFPDWGFYLSLLIGFGVVETMARVAKYKRGTDLQLAAMAVITCGLILSRVFLAQRFGVTIGDLNTLSETVLSAETIEVYGGPAPATLLLRLRLVPDLVYLALPYLIAWLRFR